MPEHAPTQPPNVPAPLTNRDKHHKSTINALSHTPNTTQHFS
jgi:hypothetical protein